MEESLTLDEVYLLLKVMHEGEYSRRKFAAALKGIDLEDEEGEKSQFDLIREQADEILAEQGLPTGNREFAQNEVSDLFGLTDTDSD